MRWLICVALVLGGCTQKAVDTDIVTGALQAPRETVKRQALPLMTQDTSVASDQDEETFARTAQLASAGTVPRASAIETGTVAAVAAPPSAPPQQTALALPPSLKPGATERVSGNLYRVSADVRRYPDPADRDNFMLLMAAEATKSRGGTHFKLVPSNEHPCALLPVLKSLVSGDAESRFTTYVRVFTLDPLGPGPIGAMSADEIIYFFGSRYNRAPA